ncbi:hypothetical protein [Pseudopelagicola sp. nBUS_19]|mgnify:FL=1
MLLKAAAACRADGFDTAELCAEADELGDIGNAMLEALTAPRH